MKTPIFAIALVLSVAGCSQKVTQVPGLDRILTSSEFIAQPVLRDRVLKFCADDPGRYRTDPNCVNSQQSVRASMTGNGNFPRLDTSLPPLGTTKK